MQKPSKAQLIIVFYHSKNIQNVWHINKKKNGAFLFLSSVVPQNPSFFLSDWAEIWYVASLEHLRRLWGGFGGIAVLKKKKLFLSSVVPQNPSFFLSDLARIWYMASSEHLSRLWRGFGGQLTIFSSQQTPGFGH